jgi:hypothetical protein
MATAPAAAGPVASQFEGVAPGAPAEALPDPGAQAMALGGTDAGQPGSAPGDGAGLAAGERPGERRGRRRGRRGRRGGGPREGAAGGQAAFTPNDAEGGTDDYSGDDAEPSDGAEGAAQAANGHAGQGGDFPMSEPPRSEPRGGASISWTGMAVEEVAPEAPAAPEAAEASAEPANDREPVIEATTVAAAPAVATAANPEATAAEVELEPSAIDTAKLPKLEAPAEDAPAPVVVHPAALEPAAADLPGAAGATPSAPVNDGAPLAPPSRVVWSSGPAPQVTDRSRED